MSRTKRGDAPEIANIDWIRHIEARNRELREKNQQLLRENRKLRDMAHEQGRQQRLL